MLTSLNFIVNAHINSLCTKSCWYFIVKTMGDFTFWISLSLSLKTERKA